MRKYLIIFIFILFTVPCVWGQTIKRTTKSPTFFVPNDTFKNKTEKEKLSATKNKNYTRGNIAHIKQTTVESTDTLPKEHLNMRYDKAPVDEILKAQPYLSKEQLSEYKKSIVNSYALSVQDLQQLLQKEYDDVNEETLRMEAALRYLKTASPAYQLANFQLETQISQDMTNSRKHYKTIKQRFSEIIKKQESKKVYIIEAKSSLFWDLYEQIKSMKKNENGIKFYLHSHPVYVTYISIFDDKYNRQFSYYRQHLNMLKNRRIPAPDRTDDSYIDTETVKMYQQLFDDYINDLNRIGKGLDINNPLLLRQLNEMQDKTISM